MTIIRTVSAFVSLMIVVASPAFAGSNASPMQIKCGVGMDTDDNMAIGIYCKAAASEFLEQAESTNDNRSRSFLFYMAGLTLGGSSAAWYTIDKQKGITMMEDAINILGRCSHGDSEALKFRKLDGRYLIHMRNNTTQTEPF